VYRLANACDAVALEYLVSIRVPRRSVASARIESRSAGMKGGC
jgi:hypothetical protein